MKAAYRPELGYILSDRASGNRITNLTADDQMELMFGGLKYDRRKSFTNVRNRQWADGIAW